MTLVQVAIARPGPDGTPRPARGYLRWEPSRGKVANETGAVILPLPFVVALENGNASVEIAPTGPDWAWRVTYQLLGFAHETHYFLVPELPAVDFSSLVEVDPLSLTPRAQPPAAWYEYVDAINRGQVGAVKVVTGSEARPAFGAVIWLGGTTQPVNMADGTDVWFQTN